LSQRRYLYWWADGIHFNPRGEDDRACLLVIIGVLPDDTKAFVVFDDGVRESEQSGCKMLVRQRDHQGLAPGRRHAGLLEGAGEGLSGHTRLALLGA